MSDDKTTPESAEAEAEAQDKPETADEATSPPEAASEAAPEATPKEPPPRRPSYLFLVLVTFVSLALDLGTKFWAKGRLEDVKSFADRRIEVIPGFMDLIFARNKGGAWGMLQHEPESIRRPFFLGISALAIIFIVSLYRKTTDDQKALKWGLPLVLGGALGNLVNRIQYNYVVDFIDMYVTYGRKEYHWPTYNIADIAIVVGVGLMAVDMFTSRKHHKPKPVAESKSARMESGQSEGA